MNNFVADNTADADLDAIVIWQYDLSPRICALIDQLKQWFNDTTGSVWDDLSDSFNIDSDYCDDFALSILGKIIGVPRFNVTVNGDVSTMPRELYRRIVVARFRLLNGGATMPDFRAFCDYVFGDGVVVPVDSHDMAMSFTWEGDDPTDDFGLAAKYVFDNYMDSIVEYPTGVYNNTPSGSAMFWMGENTGDKPTDVPSEFFYCGGFDNSSFTWKRKED